MNSVFYIDNGRLKHLGPDFAAYIINNVHTTPDIVLSNNKIYHNHITETGAITPSDHIPIIFTISATAVETEAPTRSNQRKADWEKLKKNNIRNNINKVKPPNYTSHQVDKSLKKLVQHHSQCNGTAHAQDKNKNINKAITEPNNKKKHTIIIKTLKTKS